MDWLTFFAEIIKASAWPAALVFTCIYFREPIQALISRIRKGKVGGAEFEFAEIVRTLKQEVDPPNEADAESTIVPPAPLRVAAEPRSVILEAWLQVEAAAERLGIKHGLTNSLQKGSIGLAVRLLRKNGILEDRDERLYKELFALRSSAAHELEFNPSVDSVLNFISLAQQLEARFLELAR